jgi:hypothetical protein
MKNITVALDEEIARWAKNKAAERETSVSMYVRETLREIMRKEFAYKKAMRRFLARKPIKLRAPEDRYPSREKLHER